MQNKDLEIFYSLKHTDYLYFRSIPTSYSSMRPGDLVVFKYDLSEEGITDYYPRLCLVVKNQTGKIGYFSLKENWLLSCFRLNDAPLSVVKYIIKFLYKDRNKCSYDVIKKGLTGLLGSINYRTYMLRRIDELQRFSPDKNKITEDEE